MSSLVWRTQWSVSANYLRNLKGKTWLVTCFGLEQKKCYYSIRNILHSQGLGKKWVSVSHGPHVGERVGIRFILGLHGGLNIFHPTGTDITTRFLGTDKGVSDHLKWICQDQENCTWENFNDECHVFEKLLKVPPRESLVLLYTLSPESTKKPARVLAV